MWVKYKKGVSGYWKGRSFRYPAGREADVVDAVALDHIRHGLAEKIEAKDVSPVEAVAVTPVVRRSETTVVNKRRRV